MMPGILLAVSPTDSSTRGMVLVSFLAVIVAILFMSVFFGPERDDVDDFYAAGRKSGPLGGALALSGAYISAYSILGIAGLIALSGYDGLLMAAANVVAFGLVLPLASRLRERGRYTMGDLLADRVPGPAVRIASALVTLAAVVPFLIVTLTAAGAYLAGVLGLTGVSSAKALTALLGCLIVCATVFGGMRGTRAMQIVKTVMLAVSLITFLLLLFGRIHGSVSGLIDQAVVRSGHPSGFLRPGLLFGDSLSGRLDLISMGLTIVLGAALMPNVAMHLMTARDSGVARRMVRHSILMLGGFFVAVAAVGLGAAALVGGPAIKAVDPTGNVSTNLLTNVLISDLSSIGGAMFISLVASGAFITTLAVVAGLTLAAAATISHDVYAHALGKRVTELREVSAARWASAGVGAICVFLAVLSQGTDMQWTAMLGFSIAASAILPPVLAVLYWRRCSRLGVLFALYGGLACALVLEGSSPVFSGNPGAFFSGQDFSWFPLHTSTLVSVPAAFLFGWIGNAIGTRRQQPAAGEYRSASGPRQGSRL